MSLNVLILPKRDAGVAARAATLPVRVPTDDLVLHVFCDGSYKYGSFIRRTKPRAALAVIANIWPPGATEHERTSRGCFIPCDHPDDNSVIAEALALAEGSYVAIEQIARMEEKSAISPTDKVEVVFWSDCQKVLKGLGKRGRAPELPKRVQHILDIIKLKTLEIQRSRKNVCVRFFWCPAECVEPHDTADHLSKVVRMRGGGSKSKALSLFHGLPHKAILAALAQPYEPWEDASQSEDEQIEADQGEMAYGEDDQSEANQTTNMSTPIAHVTDEYQIIHSAVGHLAAPQREMMVTAIKLQEMVNSLRAEDQDYEAAGQEHKVEDQSVNPQGQGHEQDDSRDEEDQHFYDARETADAEDEDKSYDAQEPADGDDRIVELAMAGGRVGRPSRVRALWNWLRGRPRL